MCLDTLTARAGAMPEAVIGYKIVRRLIVRQYDPIEYSIDVSSPVDRPNLTVHQEYAYAPDFYQAKPVPVKQGWAMKDDADPVMTAQCGKYDDGPRVYLPGVHAYLSPIPQAFILSRLDPYTRVVKVYLRGPICFGRQSGLDVVVYKEMTILEEV